MADKWEFDALEFDPFAGDKDDAGYKIIDDKMVTCRKPVRCATCGGMTEVGTRCRRMTARGEDGYVSFLYCEKCCRAMAEWVNGNEDALMQRLEEQRE